MNPWNFLVLKVYCIEAVKHSWSAAGLLVQSASGMTILVFLGVMPCTLEVDWVHGVVWGWGHWMGVS